MIIMKFFLDLEYISYKFLTCDNNYKAICLFVCKGSRCVSGLARLTVIAGVKINARPLAPGEQISRGMSRFFAQVVRPGEWMFQFISSVMRTNTTKLLKYN